MYGDFRSFLFNMIPGYCVSDLVYLGVIIFIIAGFIASKKWTPFISVAIFAFIFKLLDLLVFNQSASMILGQFMHIITLPLVFTLFYTKK